MMIDRDDTLALLAIASDLEAIIEKLEERRQIIAVAHVQAGLDALRGMVDASKTDKTPQ